jgi:hypothetical protein
MTFGPVEVVEVVSHDPRRMAGKQPLLMLVLIKRRCCGRHDWGQWGD